ncbi:MAG TPA: HXXEE domain-containing protein [Pyrinomonadaceae bacterium]|nr:HXXEE domain-containing protein [Pyrinomonadaceae bacterium]
MPGIRNYGRAWVALCLALAVHATDEALTDFLSVYNPIVLSVRQRLPSLPLPTFTFKIWLTGLVLSIIFLLLLSPFVFRGAWWMTPLSYFFGAIMLGNGLLHIAGSFYLGRLMPGVYSAPLLLAASVYLLIQATIYATSNEYGLSD